jgi:hypothetical protein
VSEKAPLIDKKPTRTYVSRKFTAPPSHVAGASVLPEKWRISTRLLTNLRRHPGRFEDYQ